MPDRSRPALAHRDAAPVRVHVRQFGWEREEARSASVRSYLEEALAPATRKTYATAVEQYKNHAESRGWNPDAEINAERAEEYLAAIADRGKLATGSIKIHRAALGNYHVARWLSPNPFASDRVSLLINGIANAKSELERSRRAAKRRSDGVTMNMIRQLAAKFEHGTHEQLLAVGACALACGGGLRPSEFLGSAAYPERRLQLAQVSFFADPAATLLLTPALAASSSPASLHNPDHVSIALHISKTNQRRGAEFVHIAAPEAVMAIWRWACVRGNVAGCFLQRSGYVPLRATTLLNFARTQLLALGHALFLTGKCFRIGATSTLNSAGASSHSLSVLGRWRTGTMWTRYADPASHKNRALDVSRRM